MEDQKQKIEIPNVDHYVDVEGISTKKLNLGLWYVEHMKQFRLGVIIFLAAVGTVAWIYAIYGFGDYLIRGMKEDEILARELAVSGFINHNYFAQTAPKDIEPGPVYVFRTGGKSDLTARISNGNLKHWGEFEYFFIADGKEFGREAGFILPGETKYLMALAQEAASQNVQLRIEKLKWHRIKTREIDNWSEFRDSRLDLAISETRLVPLSDENLNQLSFRVGNNTAYNYWKVDFSIVLFGSQGNVVGVNRYGLSELMSGESKDVNIVWPGILPQANQIMVVPEVNIMKSGAYVKFEGGIGEEK